MVRRIAPASLPSLDDEWSWDGLHQARNTEPIESRLGRRTLILGRTGPTAPCGGRGHALLVWLVIFASLMVAYNFHDDLAAAGWRFGGWRGGTD